MLLGFQERDLILRRCRATPRRFVKWEKRISDSTCGLEMRSGKQMLNSTRLLEFKTRRLQRQEGRTDQETIALCRPSSLAASRYGINIQ
ncbi:hypothetical protein E2C01_065856 [Portunus trituberculatus]|uniref:Uncharacterized protein n=1 Tax=Portunus trituberculatus TaxID=210409 RepID=A0A5B7HNQ0_PORTR|nr:hypothetical protein [Portunus trituberculatus]